MSRFFTKILSFQDFMADTYKFEVDAKRQRGKFRAFFESGCVDRLKLSELAISQLRYIWKTALFEMGINGFFSVQMPKKLNFILKKRLFWALQSRFTCLMPTKFPKYGHGAYLFCTLCPKPLKEP